MSKIFVLGDEHNKDITFSELRKFPDVVGISYQQAFSDPKRIASNVPVLLGFPYSLWDAQVETGEGLYGVNEFGEAIKKLSEQIAEVSEKMFPAAQYVNHPLSILIERDKFEVKKRLKKQGIKVAVDLEKSVDAVLEEIDKNKGVYIKVRFGSMGKGITYLTQDRWTTNFQYDGRNISNHPGDNNWKEIEITRDYDFLKKILEEDVVVERAIQNQLTNGYKFDLRGHAIFGKSESQFAYGRATKDCSVTNIAQGARKITLKEIQENVSHEKVKEALRLIGESASILGFGYAGVDILFEGDDYKPVFLEINSFPTPVMAEKLFPALYQEIKKRCAPDYGISSSQPPKKISA